MQDHFRLQRGGKSPKPKPKPRPLEPPICDFDLRASHARKILPAALAYVSFGFVLAGVDIESCKRAFNSVNFHIEGLLTKPYLRATGAPERKVIANYF